MKPTESPTLPVSKVRTNLCRILAGDAQTLTITVKGKPCATLTVHELPTMEV